MAECLDDAITGRVLVLGLVDGVAHDEHVIGADADEEERHQLVDAGRLASAQVHEAKSGDVSEGNTDQTSQAHDTAAVRWAKRSQEEEQVDDHKDDGAKNQTEIIVDIFYDGLEETIDSLQVDVCSLDIHLPLVESLMDFLFKA